jgi:single-strand DNA-binding protein
MPNYASVTLAGHLGRDCETKYLPAGDAITSFSIATSRKWKDKSGEQKEETTWWNCSMFGKRGEVIAKYLRKGDPILIHGEPSMRKYQTQDGRDGVSLDVRVSDFAFIGAKGDQTRQEPRGGGAGDGAYQPADHARQAAYSASGGGTDKLDDDIPFAPCMKRNEYLF